MSLVSFGSSEVSDVDSEEVSVAGAALQSYLSKNTNKKKLIIMSSSNHRELKLDGAIGHFAEPL